MQQLARVGPSSIEVCANIVASVVSIHYSIWIQHGNNLENKSFSQDFGLLVVFLQQEIDGSLNHK
jgi:hypothetical protein